MTGQTKLPRWRYDFDCSRCANRQEVHDFMHDGTYCVILMLGTDPLHADDDRVVRCDAYQKEVRK